MMHAGAVNVHLYRDSAPAPVLVLVRTHITKEIIIGVLALDFLKNILEIPQVEEGVASGVGCQGSQSFARSMSRRHLVKYGSAGKHRAARFVTRRSLTFRYKLRRSRGRSEA